MNTTTNVSIETGPHENNCLCREIFFVQFFNEVTDYASGRGWISSQMGFRVYIYEERRTRKGRGSEIYEEKLSRQRPGAFLMTSSPTNSSTRPMVSEERVVRNPLARQALVPVKD